MKNTQNNVEVLDLSLIDLSTMSIDEFKNLKIRVNANFDKELSELESKLPHNYAAILSHSHGFNAVHVRDVKNGRRRNSKILQALKQLVKSSSQNAQTLITVENE